MEENRKEDIKAQYFTWYYFNNDEYIKTSSIEEIKSVLLKPWTAATRISSLSEAETENVPGGVPRAYAIVNKKGILVFENDKIDFYIDKTLFEKRTAGLLVFFRDTPIFNLYKNDFFSEDSPSLLEEVSEGEKDIKSPFLAQFDTRQNIAYPILNTQNLTFLIDNQTKLLAKSPPFEVNSFNYDGKIFTCSAKASSKERGQVEFRYFTISFNNSPTQTTPENTSGVNFAIISENTYRKTQDYQDFNNAPERIKELLSTIPEEASFTLTSYSAGGASAIKYQAGENQNDSNSLKGISQLSSSWSLCLFEDGTLFFKGALHNGYILNNGKTVALRLPKLPSGFIYSGAAISGNTLIVSWEENAFFKTGRTGFITVKLNEILK